MTTQIAVNGAAGRMGEAVIEAAQGRDDVEPVVGFDVADVESVAGVPVEPPEAIADALATHQPAVVVDFSLPESTAQLVGPAREAGVGLVVGTTGFDDAGLDELRAASEDVPVLKATNFSRGIQALLRAVDATVPALDDYDLELIETHHNDKVDAPSGTANTIVDRVQDHRDVEPVSGREGHAPREDDEIGVFASRAGDIRGEHRLAVAGNDEVLTLAHRAEDRGVFAAGALDAAAWLDDRDPEWYSFGDVIDDA